MSQTEKLNLDQSQSQEKAYRYEKYHETELRQFVESMGGFEKLKNTIVIIHRSNTMLFDSLGESIENLCKANGGLIVYFDDFNTFKTSLYTLTGANSTPKPARLNYLLNLVSTRNQIAVFSDFGFKTRILQQLLNFISFLNVAEYNNFNKVNLYSPFSSEIGDVGNASILKNVVKHFKFGQLYFLRENADNTNQLCENHPLLELIIDEKDDIYNATTKIDFLQKLGKLEAKKLQSQLKNQDLYNIFYLICIFTIFKYPISNLTSTIIIEEMGFSQINKFQLQEIFQDRIMVSQENKSNFAIVDDGITKALRALLPSYTKIKLGKILLELAQGNHSYNTEFRESDLFYKWLGLLLSRPNHIKNEIFYEMNIDISKAEPSTKIKIKNEFPKFIEYCQEITGSHDLKESCLSQIIF